MSSYGLDILSTNQDVTGQDVPKQPILNQAESVPPVQKKNLSKQDLSKQKTLMQDFLSALKKRAKKETGDNLRSIKYMSDLAQYSFQLFELMQKLKPESDGQKFLQEVSDIYPALFDESSTSEAISVALLKLSSDNEYLLLGKRLKSLKESLRRTQARCDILTVAFFLAALSCLTACGLLLAAAAPTYTLSIIISMAVLGMAPIMFALIVVPTKNNLSLLERVLFNSTMKQTERLIEKIQDTKRVFVRCEGSKLSQYCIFGQKSITGSSVCDAVEKERLNIIAERTNTSFV